VVRLVEDHQAEVSRGEPLNAHLPIALCCQALDGAYDHWRRISQPVHVGDQVSHLDIHLAADDLRHRPLGLPDEFGRMRDHEHALA